MKTRRTRVVYELDTKRHRARVDIWFLPEIKGVFSPSCHVEVMIQKRSCDWPPVERLYFTAQSEEQALDKARQGVQAYVEKG